MYDLKMATYLVESAPSYLAKVDTREAANWYVQDLPWDIRA